ACTEMIMLTGGDNKDSIFEESEEDYDARARYCKEAYGVDPRPNWITTEFENWVSLEKICEQYYLLQWPKRSLEWWRGVEEYFQDRSCTG
ncbi:hypothetical protein CISIN_1g0106562mg, partial [Citrus sinensis]